MGRTGQRNSASHPSSQGRSMTDLPPTAHDAPEPVLGAVRAYMVPAKTRQRRPPHDRPRATGWPPLVLIIDTETSMDTAQRLRFGSYRFCRWEVDNTKRPRLICVE